MLPVAISRLGLNSKLLIFLLLISPLSYKLLKIFFKLFSIFSYFLVFFSLLGLYLKLLILLLVIAPLSYYLSTIFCKPFSSSSYLLFMFPISSSNALIKLIYSADHTPSFLSFELLGTLNLFLLVFFKVLDSVSFLILSFALSSIISS